MKQSLKSHLLIFCFLCFSNLISQISISGKNVISLDSTLQIPSQLTNNLAKYKFILVGEMHGTKEPVKFVRQLAIALSEKKKILVGFEIPADQLKLKSKTLTKIKLSKTKFFKNSRDGRNSEEWMKTILALSGMPNVTVFFFDAVKSQSHLDRDSAMFLNLKTEYLKDTSCLVITISGNIHNQLLPYKNSKTLGYFISSYLSGFVLSVNHQYESGTLYNNTAKVKTVNANQAALKSISLTPDYFLF